VSMLNLGVWRVGKSNGWSPPSTIYSCAFLHLLYLCHRLSLASTRGIRSPPFLAPKTRHTSRPSDLHHDAHQASLLATESDRSPVHTPDSGESFCSALGPARVTLLPRKAHPGVAVRLREHPSSVTCRNAAAIDAGTALCRQGPCR